MTNDRLLDRAHHDLYISLVQRFRVKSTIQNFDSRDGNFGNKQLWTLWKMWGQPSPDVRRAQLDLLWIRLSPMNSFTFFDSIHRKLAYSKLCTWAIVSTMPSTCQTIAMPPITTMGTRISVWRGR